jgi:hypothetical protein
LEQTTVKFLSHYLSAGTISTNPHKVKAIADWPTLKTVRDIQRFLGAANYWHHFIKDFSKIAHPLHLLLHTDQPFNWTSFQQTTFDTIKHKLTTAQILLIPDKTKPYLLKTDASGYALRAVLSQEGEDG